jgi:short-subunit dehydrogenase
LNRPLWRNDIIAFPALQPEGKVIIITGASDGIGAQLAAQFRSKGARLVLSSRNEAKLHAASGPDDLVVAGDLTVESVRESLIERTLKRFGCIDALINNAGRGSYYLPSASPLGEVRSLFELNFFAPFHLAQLATPSLCLSKGTLVNVNSIAGQISLPWLPLYSASKFALASLTSSQRMELRRHGVNVMGVFPGYVDTNFQTHSAGSPPPAEVVKGRRFAVTAEQCAAAIIRGMERRSRNVVTPRLGLPLVWLNRLFPGFMESRMERV